MSELERVEYAKCERRLYEGMQHERRIDKYEYAMSEEAAGGRCDEIGHRHLSLLLLVIVFFLLL